MFERIKDFVIGSTLSGLGATMIDKGMTIRELVI